MVATGFLCLLVNRVPSLLCKLAQWRASLVQDESVRGENHYMSDHVEAAATLVSYNITCTFFYLLILQQFYNKLQLPSLVKLLFNPFTSFVWMMTEFKWGRRMSLSWLWLLHYIHFPPETSSYDTTERGGTSPLCFLSGSNLTYFCSMAQNGTGHFFVWCKNS